MTCPFDLDAEELPWRCRGPRHIICPRVLQGLEAYMEEEGFAVYRVLASRVLGRRHHDDSAGIPYHWHLSCYRFMEKPEWLKGSNVIVVWGKPVVGSADEWVIRYGWWVEER